MLTLHPNFWETLTRHRRNFRRKRQAAAALRFEVVTGLSSMHQADIYALYRNTLERSNIQFEQLAPAYFEATSALSTYFLAFHGDTLVGFIQTMRKGPRMVALYMGLDPSMSREFGVYFALAMKAVDHALASGCTQLELGETHYQFKKSLGCELVPTSVYFRHRHCLAHRLMRHLSFLFEPSEAELR